MSGYQTYRKQQIESSSPLGMVLLVYDALIQSLTLSRAAIEANEGMPYGQITRALRALLELVSSLDYEEGGQIAGNLASLYAYMYRRLTEAQEGGDMVAAIDEVIGLAKTLQEGWQGLAQMDEKENEGEVQARSMNQAVVA